MSSSSSHSPCAACKFLRRKCTQECVFAPYFPPDQPQKFASVHRVYGASNVAKLLNELPASQREDTVVSLAYEAEARLRDPVFGCVGFISILNNRLKQIHSEIAASKKELTAYIGPQAMILPSYALPPPFPLAFPESTASPTGHSQLMNLHPHQQQQQQMLIENSTQRQQMRFNVGFDNVSGGDGGFGNQINGGGGSPHIGGGGVMSPSLGLGSFDHHHNPYQMHQMTPHHHSSIDYQLQAQLLLESQQKPEGKES